MSTTETQHRDKADSSVAGPSGPRAPFTLAIDIGGSRIKASVLDATGLMTAERLVAITPKVPDPKAVIAEIAGLVRRLPDYNRISIGFPGVVRAGVVSTAPNLGTERWAGFAFADAMAKRFRRPVRMLNDAAVQGLGVVEGPGLECVITLGTGVGCALFRDRRLLLHLELGQHRASRKRTYDQYIGAAALAAKGPERWNRRVARAVDAVTTLTSCERLYVGGGNARRITAMLPPHVKIVSNAAGVTGGVRLWQPDMDEHFIRRGGK